MGSEAISDMFQKHLIENANLHYGEFMKDLSRLIVSKKFNVLESFNLRLIIEIRFTVDFIFHYDPYYILLT